MMMKLRTLFVFAFFTRAISLALNFVEDTSIRQSILQYLENQNLPANRRSIVIYRVGEVPNDGSFDVYENNIKFFTAAVMAHSTSAPHQAFYIFRVVGGRKNKLVRHLPRNLPNVLLTKCASNGARDVASHIHTIHILGEPILSKFHSVLLLNHETRGPFEGHHDGSWWKRIISTFDTNPNVAIVGPLISCEITPHVQTFGLTFRNEMVLKILSEFNPEKPTRKRSRNEALEIAVTTSALSLGYQISSLAYARQWNRTVFNGECHKSQGNYPMHSENPISWCDFSPETLLFMRWGGEPLARRGFYCQQTMDLLLGASTAVADLNPDLHLTLPETTVNGPMHHLAKEYDLERWHGRTNSGTEKVCFVVRTSSSLGRQKGPQKHLGNATSVEMDLDVFIPSKFTSCAV